MTKRRSECIIDDRLYAVTAPNGFRRGSMTKPQALRLARTMWREMQERGWSGEVHIYYRDGTDVPFEREE